MILKRARTLLHRNSQLRSYLCHCWFTYFSKEISYRFFVTSSYTLQLQTTMIMFKPRLIHIIRVFLSRYCIYLSQNECITLLPDHGKKNNSLERPWSEWELSFTKYIHRSRPMFKMEYSTFIILVSLLIHFYFKNVVHVLCKELLSCNNK